MLHLVRQFNWAMPYSVSMLQSELERNWHISNLSNLQQNLPNSPTYWWVIRKLYGLKNLMICVWKTNEIIRNLMICVCERLICVLKTNEIFTASFISTKLLKLGIINWQNNIFLRPIMVYFIYNWVYYSNYKSIISKGYSTYVLSLRESR